MKNRSYVILPKNLVIEIYDDTIYRFIIELLILMSGFLCSTVEIITKYFTSLFIRARQYTQIIITINY